MLRSRAAAESISKLFDAAPRACVLVLPRSRSCHTNLLPACCYTQLYCLRNALTGAIVEGDEDDIRSFHYLWALQPNEESESEAPWQVTELAVRGVMQVY